MSDLDLWSWLDNKPNRDYLKLIENTGGMQRYATSADINVIGKLGNIEFKFLDWISANRETCRKSEYNRPAYKAHLFNTQASLPGQVGFNHHNTIDYSWGVFDEHNNELKEMLGGIEAFKKMKVHYDHSLVRLLVQMPGHFQPLHVDTMSSWAATYPELNPKIVPDDDLADKMKDIAHRLDMPDHYTCDLGKIVRRVVTASGWSYGHVLAIENMFFPTWNSGDVFDIPGGVWHLSANAGIDLKITVIVTGVEQ